MKKNNIVIFILLLLALLFLLLFFYWYRVNTERNANDITLPQSDNKESKIIELTPQERAELFMDEVKKNNPDPRTNEEREEEKIDAIKFMEEVENNSQKNEIKN